jgi:hypothetical protein
MFSFYFDLVNCEWTKKDVSLFEKILYNHMSCEADIYREQKIANTKKHCYAIPNKMIQEVVNSIMLGNYQAFLDNSTNNTHPMTIVRGKIISKIKDLKVFKKYLDIYTLDIDSWAHCDFFNLNSNELNKSALSEIVIDYIKSDLVFRRRIAIILLLKHFITTDNEIDFTFRCVYFLNNETEFYVNIAISWLLCEIYIKHSNLLLDYLPYLNLNSFVKKKFFAKCRDSLRVSNEMLIILEKYLKEM